MTNLGVEARDHSENGCRIRSPPPCPLRAYDSLSPLSATARIASRSLANLMRQFRG